MQTAFPPFQIAHLMHSLQLFIQAMPFRQLGLSFPSPSLPLCRAASGTWMGVGLWLASHGRGMSPGMCQVALILLGLHWFTSGLAWPGSQCGVSVRQTPGELWRSESRRGLPFVWPSVANCVYSAKPRRGLRWVVCDPHPAVGQTRSQLAQGPQRPHCRLWVGVSTLYFWAS